MLLYLVGADSNGDAKIRNKIVAVASASVKREAVSVQCAGRGAQLWQTTRAMPNSAKSLDRLGLAGTPMF